MAMASIACSSGQAEGHFQLSDCERNGISGSSSTGVTRAVHHDILQFSARVPAIVSCGILRFNEIPVEF